jgi:sugar transferase (PEP-CTERM system associated)
MERAFYSKRTILSITMAITMVAGLSMVFFYIAPQWQMGRGMLAIQIAMVWIILNAWRLLYGILIQSATSRTGAIVLGAGEAGKAVYQLLQAPFSPYEVKGFLDDDPALLGKPAGSPAVLGRLDQLQEVARQIGAEAAILAVPRNRPVWLTRKILEARMVGMEIIETASVYERLIGRIPVQYIEDQWLLYASGFNILVRDYIQKIKRLADFMAATTLLFVSAPLMAVTALAIRLDSPGPVFYHQERVGKGGRTYTVYKFRSMCIDAEQDRAEWAQKRDPRVTRVGRWMRLFRIDELPQIWNVFTGEMSLVGPRPERPEFVKELESQTPYYNVRHTVRPGITGWAQVKYPYSASLEDSLRKLEYDLYYIKNMSLLLDIRILLKTVGVVLSAQGAR